MEERIFRVYVNTLFSGNKGTGTFSTDYTNKPNSPGNNQETKTAY